MIIFTIAVCIFLIIKGNGVPTAIELAPFICVDDSSTSLMTPHKITTDSIESNSTLDTNNLNTKILSKLHLTDALQKVSEENQWDPIFAARVEEEYAKFLYVLKQYGSPAVPSKIVDLLWHQHILETKTYFKDMKSIFGRYIHHHPSYSSEEKRETRNKFDVFAQRYALEFGSMPDDIWGNCHRKSVTNIQCDECDARCTETQCDECESRDQIVGNDCNDCHDDCWDGCNQSCHGIPFAFNAKDECDTCTGCYKCNECTTCDAAPTDAKDACNVGQCNPGDCYDCHNCQNS